MKQLIASILLTITVATTANAGDRFNNLTKEYLYGKNSTVSIEVKRVIAKDSQTSSDTLKLLYLANFLPSKGIKEVLKALVLLCNKSNLPKFELIAVGAWDNKSYQQECTYIVSANKLPVSFHKPIAGAKKWNYFSTSDIFVFTPKLPEGHPWVLVEAMAAGLPIISTDQGAIVESVKHNQNGFIVNPTIAGDVAAAIQKLLEDPIKRNSFGKQSKAFYEEKFTEKVMVENLKNVFSQVIANP